MENFLTNIKYELIDDSMQYSVNENGWYAVKVRAKVPETFNHIHELI